jgi:hypothetical protein
MQRATVDKVPGRSQRNKIGYRLMALRSLPPERNQMDDPTFSP